jgi:uncharacterized protein YegL
MRGLTKYFFVLLLSPLINISIAQKNLVPNPGFEEPKATHASRAFNTVYAPNRPLVKDWAIPTAGTADYYNSDRSTVWGSPIKKARSGQGRAGIIAKTKKLSEYTEYITTRLTEPLVEDKLYMVKMYYSLDRRCTYFAGTMGMCFTIDYMSAGTTSVLALKPQIVCRDQTKNSTCDGWVELSGIYKAYGGELYLTIGCFDTQYSIPVTDREKYQPVSKLDKQQHFQDYAYYYIDDVCVTEITDDPFCKNCCPTQPNAEKPHNNFVLMIDISSSMEEGGYLNEAKSAATGFIGDLGKNDLVSVIAFDGNAHVIVKNMPALEKDSIAKIISLMKPGSSTNVDKAVHKAYGIIDSAFIEKGHNEVVLVSDAVFKLATQSGKTIKQHYKKKNVAFTVIQFGHQRNKNLETICKKTNGKYAGTTETDMNTVLYEQVDRDYKNDYTKERPAASHFKLVQTNSIPVIITK